MKTFFLTAFICLSITSLTYFQSKAQTSPGTLVSLDKPNPWTESQLMEPADLAAMIKAPAANKLLIFNIGAVEDIKGAKHIGPVSDKANFETFKNALGPLPKNTAIVIYCGCCPFTKCPNIRPAFLELKKLGFTNFKLLNLSKNLNTNWTSKGYPLAGG
ncbi:MAG TPA: hypothetical protein DCO83_16300 [Mucilaginibacter sp.]|jgi:hypothetical protein|nr:hypothetical protein [Mucilaginibacter sp.]